MKKVFSINLIIRGICIALVSTIIICIAQNGFKISTITYTVQRLSFILDIITILLLIYIALLIVAFICGVIITFIKFRRKKK